MIRLPLAVFLAPIAPMLFWTWAISDGHISTAGTFGHGLAILIVLFAGSLYVVTLVILVPLVLVLRGYGFLSFGWVVGTSTLIGMGWQVPLDLYFGGFRQAIEGVVTYRGQDFLWKGGAYAFLLASAFCLIAGIPFHRKSKEDSETPA